MIKIITRSSKQTQDLGEAIGKNLEPGDWIGLTGNLGAGKTCFVKGLARGLGVSKNIQVTSPTFVILQTYTGRMPLHHMDFYRLHSEEELVEIGYHEIAEGGGVCVVEWCEQIKSAIPKNAIILNFEIKSQSVRNIDIEIKTNINQKVYNIIKQLV